ncbi:MAG: threonine--tRNA ligase [Deltaproteobacteria bacterium]|nr:threonine--tRNA ligase [Deltaproteobacteria bacterium]
MSITVTLPDGSRHQVEAGLSAVAALKAAGADLKGAIAARQNGRPIDLSRVIDADCELAVIPAESRDGLDVLRHSTAHLMAQAVKRLFPETQITIGPVIEDGFFYDIKKATPFTPEDLERIEAEMKAIAKQDFPVAREEMDRDEATRFFREQGEEYKAEIIAGLADQRVGLYRQGEFVDLCRGPHVSRTGVHKAFKLTGVAGAYWRGDERNEMLQRIYGTAFASKEALAEHLANLEEAKKRDHRKLGRELDLFSFDPVAPGSPFFHPKGAVVYNELIRYVRGLYAKYGYDEVVTPQVMDVELWKRSGHYDNYRENMYFTQLEEREFAVKPMNCPSHCMIFNTRKRSYRELPIRYADFGRLHRAERSGTLHGLTRVRSFSQDDAHIFCMPEQIGAEISAFLRMVDEVYGDFGFAERRVFLSTRPEKSIGSDAMWERAESALAEALRGAGMAYEINAGDGAFYGPKIDFNVVDALKRGWQLATVQLDFGALPERFDLTYVRPDGTEARPVMIHRAILGTIERFMGILIEHCAGAFPLWLAPEQARVLTLTERQETYGGEVCAALRTAGFRAEVDARNEKLGYKVREAQLAKVPYMLVVGDKEAADRTVAPRSRAGGTQQPALALDAFITQLHDEVNRRGAV